MTAKDDFTEMKQTMDAVIIIKNTRFSHYLIWNSEMLERKKYEIMYNIICDINKSVDDEIGKHRYGILNPIRKGFRNIVKKQEPVELKIIKILTDKINEIKIKNNPYILNR